jgi:hypothetical protein
LHDFAMLATHGDARCQLFVPPHGFGNHLPLLGIDHALLNTFPKPLRQGHPLPQREIDGLSSELLRRHKNQLPQFLPSGQFHSKPKLRNSLTICT